MATATAPSTEEPFPTASASTWQRIASDTHTPFADQEPALAQLRPLSQRNVAAHESSSLILPRGLHEYSPARHGSTGDGIEILGHSLIPDDERGSHVEYHILSCTTVRVRSLSLSLSVGRAL